MYAYNYASEGISIAAILQKNEFFSWKWIRTQ